MKNTSAPTWSTFNTLWQAGRTDEARRLISRMSATDAVVARRVVNGPTKAQRIESSRRMAAINAVSAKEIREHCQVSGLRRLGR